MLHSQSFSNTISVFISVFVFVLFFFTLKCKWNPHKSRRNLTEFTSLLDSYTNLFIFIDQFCHSTKKNRSHHVHNFLRTPQTDVVDKLNSIHPQLAVELLAKETVKYNLSWWPRKWWISWMNWLKHRISERIETNIWCSAYHPKIFLYHLTQYPEQV